MGGKCISVLTQAYKHNINFFPELDYIYEVNCVKMKYQIIVAGIILSGFNEQNPKQTPNKQVVR